MDWYFDCVCQVLAMIDRLFESMLLFKSGKSHQSDPWVERWAKVLPSMYVAAVYGEGLRVGVGVVEMNEAVK